MCKRYYLYSLSLLAADDCFSVRIVKTEISDQLDLEGDFLLRLEEEKIALYDLDYKKRIHEWHFDVIRRYGCSGRLFMFEAGRKARTGPGTFKLETKGTGASGRKILESYESILSERQKHI